MGKIRILFGITLFSTIFICGCQLFSKGKCVGEIGNGIRVNVVSQEISGDMDFRQTIVLTKDEKDLTIIADTKTSALEFHRDSILGKPGEMLFIYDIYLGWCIVDVNSFSIYKNFTDLPKEQALLTKLRMMESPDLIFDGTSCE